MGQQTRKTSDLKMSWSSKKSIPSRAPPVWEIAAQFFVANTQAKDTMPMEVDDCLQQYIPPVVELADSLQADTDLHASNSDLTPFMGQGLDRDHDKIELMAQDNKDDLDDAEEAGTSDQEGHGRAQDDEKDC